MNIYQKSRIACAVAAFISFLFSIYLWFSGDREAGIFVGLWVPSILSSGNLILPSPKDYHE
jgi:hypothetical protein